MCLLTFIPVEGELTKYFKGAKVIIFRNLCYTDWATPPPINKDDSNKIKVQIMQFSLRPRKIN
jgi:hypothetical protein